MSTFKFTASIVGFTLLVLACVAGITVASFVVNHHWVPWEILIALVPAAGLLGLIITVAIDRPIDRP